MFGKADYSQFHGFGKSENSANSIERPIIGGVTAEAPIQSGPACDSLPARVAEAQSPAPPSLFDSAKFHLLHSARNGNSIERPRRKAWLFGGKQSSHSITCLLLPRSFQQHLRSNVSCLTRCDWEVVRERKDGAWASAIAARVALRFALSKFIANDVSRDEWRFDRDLNGKPYLVNDPGIGFNISYTKNLAAIAFAPGLALGLDVEGGESGIRPEKIFPYLSPRERRELSSMPESVMRNQLLRIWTVKEALVKMNGSVLDENVSNIDVFDCHGMAHVNYANVNTALFVNYICTSSNNTGCAWVSIAASLPGCSNIRDIALSIYLVTC